MNILIVGNGFDLSHYLPTKYDHFMDAMGAIENWDIAKGEMGFDDLFIKNYWHKNNETEEEWQNSFFQHTKAMYKTEEIKISVSQITELKEQLKENVWYQYFSEHVREVKTWIDFELKIKEALVIVCAYMSNIETYLKNTNSLDGVIRSFKDNKEGEYFLSQKNIRVLDLLKLLEVKYRKISTDYNSEVVNFSDKWTDSFEKLAENFVIKYKGYDEFSYKKVTGFLKTSLVEFSKLFNDYLKLFDNISCKQKFLKPIETIMDRVYSFNYTSTYSRNYDDVETHFLHGRLGIENKSVLGVSDLDSNLLHKFNLWGFTKYHQKLFFDTDYQFIDEFIQKKEKLNQMIEMRKSFGLSKAASGSGSAEWLENAVQKILKENSLELNVSIWGHSLDESDSSYIKELFWFNEPYDQKVRIIVYYFNDEAKYDLLANLINILTKEQVEKWMKKGWLKFEPNPNIADLNKIEPVKLPKLQQMV